MRFSVVIPVYNGAAFLRRCLATLTASHFRDFEILVVDDGSSDDSREVAESYGAQVVVLEQRGGPARARNHGARRARGEYLVFFDADVCVHADTLALLDAHFRAVPDAAAVIGSYDDAPADRSFVSQFRNLLHHFVHQRSRKEAWTFWAGCGAIRRELFLARGGFDERYTRPCIEDIELGARLAMAGERIDLDPAIQVTHLKRWTLGSMVRTDLFDRAVPWLVLMLRTRRMPPDLNVTHVHRLSVALVWLLLLGLIVLLAALVALSKAAMAAALSMILPIVAVLLALNLDLYRYLARKRGWRFALGAVPLHWLYYFYCGLGVILGVLAYLTSPAIRPVPRRIDER